jgi:hypothetical protein
MLPRKSETLERKILQEKRPEIFLIQKLSTMANI